MNKVIITLILVISNIMTLFSQNYNFEYKKQITLDSTDSHNDWLDRVELFILSVFNSPNDVILYKSERIGVYKLSGIIVEDNIPTGYKRTITTKWSFQIIMMKIGDKGIMKIKNVRNYERKYFKWGTLNYTEPTYISWTRYEESVPKRRKIYSKRKKVLREVFKIHRQFQQLEHNFEYYMLEDINKIKSIIIE